MLTNLCSRHKPLHPLQTSAAVTNLCGRHKPLQQSSTGMATLPNHVATAFAQARQAAQVLTQQSTSAEAVQVITDLLARCAGEP